MMHYSEQQSHLTNTCVREMIREKKEEGPEEQMCRTQKRGVKNAGRERQKLTNLAVAVQKTTVITVMTTALPIVVMAQYV